MSRRTEQLLSLDEVIDAKREKNRVILYTKDGKTLILPASKHVLNLYWDVKLRNRRRAFGL